MDDLIRRTVDLLVADPDVDAYLRGRYQGQGSALAWDAAYPRGHFYSPLPDLADVKARSAQIFRTDVDVGASINLHLDAQRKLLGQLAGFYRDFDWPDDPAPGRRYYLKNPFFGHGDALSLYGMLRHLAPKQVVEVGSGFSSALMLDTDDRFLGGRTRFTFVEPYPDRLHALLRDADRQRCRIVEQPVQSVPLDVFQALGENDVLFIDSSHVSKAGSDLNRLMFDVLPALRPGVFLHFHDIFWPFEYPREWVLEGRSWNEDYLVRAFLQYNDRFQIVLFNNYLVHTCGDFLREQMPRFLLNAGGSLWLRKA